MLEAVWITVLACLMLIQAVTLFLAGLLLCASQGTDGLLKVTFLFTVGAFSVAELVHRGASRSAAKASRAYRRIMFELR